MAINSLQIRLRLRWMILVSIVSAFIAPVGYANTKNINPLNGAWDFYQGVLLNPEDPLPQKATLKVPGTWEEQTIDQKPLSAFGIGTYRLVFQTPAQLQDAAIRLPYFYGWTRIFINGEDFGEFGHFDRAKKVTTSAGHGTYLFFPTASPQIELIIQTANFTSARGGISGEILFGPAIDMARHRATRMSLDFFIISALIFMASYHMFVFAFRPLETSNAWFAIFSLDIALRTSIVGDSDILSSLFMMNGLWTWRLELITYYLGIFITVKFIGTLYPDESHRNLPKWVGGLVAPCVLVTLFTSSTVFSHTKPIMQFLNLVLIVVYGLVISKAIKNKKAGSQLFMSGFIALSLLSVIEIIATNLNLDIPRLSPWGMYLFAGFQSIVLARRLSNAYKKIEASERNIRALNVEIKEQEKTKLVLEKERAEKRLLQESLNQAQTIYRSLSAQSVPIKEVSLASYVKPAEVAGGDWVATTYDQAKNHLYILLGDVTGHDLLSALITVSCTGAYKGAMAAFCASDHYASLEENADRLISTLNRAVIDSCHGDLRLMTVALLAVNLESGEAIYLNAGHPPILRVQQRTVASIASPANPLGLNENATFGKVKFSLAHNDGIFIYSDGLIENTGHSGERLKLRQIKSILSSNSEPHAIKTAVLSSTESLWGNNCPKDDASFIYLKWLGKSA